MELASDHQGARCITGYGIRLGDMPESFHLFSSPL
jgi:hypothetical protein